MLSYKKVGVDHVDYLENSVAQGVDDYYMGEGEAPGRWVGGGAADLNLEGRVGRSQFKAVLSGVDPATGETLGARWGTETVAGWDFTFGAPKSVSVLYGTADRGTQRRMVDAHDRAIDASVEMMDEVACWVRRGKGGQQRLKATGFVAAVYRHRMSRAGDPHLHSHVVFGNKAKGIDGRWSSLDGRDFTQMSKTLSQLYRAHLRHELSDLGLTWEMQTEGRDRGMAELAGLPEDVLRAFSKRRVEIEQGLADSGQVSPGAAQVVTLDTRRSKQHQVDPDSLRSRWREEAAQAGWSERDTARLLDSGLERIESGQHQRTIDRERGTLATHLLGDDGLTGQRAVFGEHDVLRRIATHCVAGASIPDARQLATEVLANERVVRVGESRDLMRGGVPMGAGADLYTTRELLAVERELLALGPSAMGQDVAVAQEPAVEAALNRRAYLSDQQRQAAREITRRGDGISTLAALGGAGKTTLMSVIGEAYTASGYQVVGSALAARAAAVLHDESGIPSFTLAQIDWAARQRELQWTDRHVLVIDEAGQVGTRQLHRIVKGVRDAGGKVVLVGDTRQLPEIEAGGAFRSLVLKCRKVTLTENRRQTDPMERRRLAELRHGDPGVAFYGGDNGVVGYTETGAVYRGEDAYATRDQLVADWFAEADSRPGSFVEECEKAPIATVTNDGVNDINLRAQMARYAAGHLGEDLVAGVRTGDYVITRDNQRRMGVINGDLWTVAAVGEDGVRLESRHGKPEATVPLAYAEEHLRLAYAFTTQTTQGSTYRALFALGSDGTYREAGYVLASRATEGVRWYVSAPAVPPGLTDDCGHDHTAEEEERDPLVRMVAALKHSRMQTMASETPAGEPRPVTPVGNHSPRNLREMAAEVEALRAHIGPEPPDVGARLADVRGALDRASAAELAARLRNSAAEENLSAVRSTGHGWRRRMDPSAVAAAEQALIRTGEQIERAEVARKSAQLRATALSTQADTRAAWLVEHEPQIRRVHDLEAAAADREAQLGRDSVANPTADLVEVIGRPPREPGEASTAWQRAAGAAEAYRELAMVTPDGQARLDQPHGDRLLDVLQVEPRDQSAADARERLGDALEEYERVRDSVAPEVYDDLEREPDDDWLYTS